MSQMAIPELYSVKDIKLKGYGYCFWLCVIQVQVLRGLRVLFICSCSVCLFWICKMSSSHSNSNVEYSLEIKV